MLPLDPHALIFRMALAELLEIGPEAASAEVILAALLPRISPALRKSVWDELVLLQEEVHSLRDGNVSPDWYEETPCGYCAMDVASALESAQDVLDTALDAAAGLASVTVSEAA